MELKKPSSYIRILSALEKLSNSILILEQLPNKEFSTTFYITEGLDDLDERLKELTLEANYLADRIVALARTQNGTVYKAMGEKKNGIGEYKIITKIVT